MAISTIQYTALVVLLLLGTGSFTQAARHLKKFEDKRKDKDSTDTQGSAYSYSQGNDPGGSGDAFTWHNAESSSTSSYNGVYYKDGTVTVEAGDKAQGGWSGSYVKNDPDEGTKYAISDNFNPEYAFQRGVHVVSGTYLGARAVAGSGSMFGAAKDATVTATIDAYAPTAIDHVAIDQNQLTQRSAALTNIDPKSAAQSGIGNGPAALASGWEVSSMARAGRDKPVPVTIGSRQEGDKGIDLQKQVLENKSNKHRLLKRRQLLVRSKPLLLHV